MHRHEYIIAPSYFAARKFIFKQGGDSMRFVYVDRIERLYGLHQAKVHVLPYSQFREDYVRLILEATIRELEVVYV